MITTTKNMTKAGISSDDVYSDEFSRRRIYLTETITDSVASDICAQLNCLASKSHDDIHIIINSPGGSVSAGMSILDTTATISANGITICTYVLGLAASMAALLASAGTKGHRFIGENADMMIHQPLGGASGQASDVEVHARQILKTKTRLHRILSKNTGQPFEKISKDCDRDYYLDADEAIAYGLCDALFQGFEDE